jgi:ribosomal protein L37E
MNFKQAKALIGIDPRKTLAGRDGYAHAHGLWKSATVKARKAGNDALAAQLSEADKVLEKRLVRNMCAVCGQPISRKATHCRLHQREAPTKALQSGREPAQPLPPAYRSAAARSNPPAKERKVTTDSCALCGYWAPPVQAVVKRWQIQIGNEWCKHYVPQAMLSIKGGCRLDIQPIHPGHMGYVLEFLSALYEVWTDKAKPYRWLLDYANAADLITAADGSVYVPPDLSEPVVGECGTIVELGLRSVAYSYRKIREAIITDGGPTFTEDYLCTAARRLRLTDSFSS